MLSFWLDRLKLIACIFFSSHVLIKVFVDGSQKKYLNTLKIVTKKNNIQNMKLIFFFISSKKLN